MDKIITFLRSTETTPSILRGIIGIISIATFIFFIPFIIGSLTGHFAFSIVAALVGMVVNGVIGMTLVPDPLTQSELYGITPIQYRDKKND